MQNNTKKPSVARSVGTVGLITTLSRVLGMLREMVRAWALGTGMYSDAFVLAFSLPNLFRRLSAEGAMSNAFIPVFCQVDKEEGRARAMAFARSFFWTLTLILTLLTLVFVWQADWLVAHIFAAGYSGETLEVTIFLTRVMFVYMILISLAAVAQGVLNSISIFWISAATPVALNLAIIGMALALKDQFENPALSFSLGVVLGGVLQLGMQFPHLYKSGFSLLGSLWDPKVKEVFRLILPTIFGVGIYQINILISNLIATGLGEGALSSLTFSNRLLELVLGVVVVSITTVTLPRLSGFFTSGDLKAVTLNISRTLKIVAFFSLPVTIITLALKEEIVRLLFLRGEFNQTSLQMTAGALFYHILGLIFISFNRVVLTAYQGARRLQITVWVAGVAMVVNLAACYGLSELMGHLGIAAASSLSQAVQWFLLAWFIGRLGLQNLWTWGFWLSLIKSTLAALALYYPLLWLKAFMIDWPLLISLPFMGLLAVVGYVVLGLLFKNPESEEALGLLRKAYRK